MEFLNYDFTFRSRNAKVVVPRQEDSGHPEITMLSNCSETGKHFFSNIHRAASSYHELFSW